MALFVYVKGSFLAEALPANGAHVRLLFRMGSHVNVQSGFHSEILPAVRALVWLLPRVDPLVDGEVRLPIETLPTVRALVELLSRVDSLVQNKGPSAEEAFPALGAGVRLLSRVDSLVLGDVRFLAKAFPTVRAVVRLLVAVAPLVAHKIGLVREKFATLRADVLLPNVTLLVHDQLGSLGEALLTVGAFIRIVFWCFPWQGLLGTFRSLQISRRLLCFRALEDTSSFGFVPRGSAFSWRFFRWTALVFIGLNLAITCQKEQNNDISQRIQPEQSNMESTRPT